MRAKVRIIDNLPLLDHKIQSACLLQVFKTCMHTFRGVYSIIWFFETNILFKTLMCVVVSLKENRVPGDWQKTSTRKDDDILISTLQLVVSFIR